MFVDNIKIYVKAGDGGNGAVTFHREKYVSAGGPDGGDGGRGGNIIFRVDEGANTLLAFRYKRKFVAENGANGMGGKKHGKTGADVIIPVPEGTLIRDVDTLLNISLIRASLFFRNLTSPTESTSSRIKISGSTIVAMEKPSLARIPEE